MKKYIYIILFKYSLFFAQNPGSIDTSFLQTSVFNGVNNEINSILVQNDNKIVIGGNFTQVNGGEIINRILRLNNDGTFDSTFNIGTGFNNSINSLALQQDGKLIVGGDFTKYKNIDVNRIIRLNTDGSIDNTFLVGTGFNEPVKTIFIQSDGKILIGGNFSNYNETNSNRIIRLNSNGTIDNSFSIGNGFNNSVKSIAIRLDGKIMVGGDFTRYNNAMVFGLICLNPNGIKDITFPTVNDPFRVNAIIIDPTSPRIYVAYDLELYGTDKIMKIHYTGEKDIYWQKSIINIDSKINSLVLQSDGKLIAVGNFSNRIIRYEQPYGNIDLTLNTGVGFNDKVNCIAIQKDGKILTGGKYNAYKEVPTNRITRLLPTGVIENSFCSISALNNTTKTIVTDSDGKIFLGGNFTSYNGLTTNRIAKLLNNGAIDNSFNIGSGFDGTVNSITIQSDGKILVGGDFSSYNGKNANLLVRLNKDGSLDNTFINGYDDNTTKFNSIQTIKVQSDGKILVGAIYKTGISIGSPSNLIRRLNPDGTNDNMFLKKIPGVIDIQIQTDNKIIVITNNSLKNVYRLNLDGSIDNTFDVDRSSPYKGINGSVQTIQIQTDGKILIGGDFTGVKSYISNKILRLNTDGSVDTSFSIGTGFNDSVKSIITQSDCGIIVGGNFTNYNGLLNSRITKLNIDGSIDYSFESNNGFDNSVFKIAIQTDGKILVGGNFNNYNENTYKKIIRLNNLITNSNCSVDKRDDDKDGVFNYEDSCTNTPFGELTNVKGCSESQIDDDKDGIMNNQDNCANTPPGELVNVNGCSQNQIFTLPYNNFSIETKSETCASKNNGQIIINATQTYNYTATINGTNYTFVNNSLTVSNLAPGVYTICIGVTGKTFQQCYSVTIGKGGSITGKSSFNSNKAIVEITEGTAPFEIFINGTHQFETSETNFAVGVKQGDLLEVKTAIACEGIFAKTILDGLVGVQIYPNPTAGLFEITIPTSKTEVEVELYSIGSQLISKRKYPVNNQRVQLSLEKESDGIYFAKINLDSPVSLTIIKKS